LQGLNWSTFCVPGFLPPPKTLGFVPCDGSVLNSLCDQNLNEFADGKPTLFFAALEDKTLVTDRLINRIRKASRL
ncbi:uncharacterized, partial [Tachysurus ichikawai]